MKHFSILRPLGSGIAMAVPLFIGITTNSPQICSMGTLGAFSYLAFQHISQAYNLKAITFHGLALIVAFILGGFTALYPWSGPFVIGLLTCIAYLLTKIFQIPKPNYFFVIMIYATAYNLDADNFVMILHQCTYLLYGIAGSLVAGLLISVLEQLPKKVPPTRFQKLSILDKYYVTLYQQPDMIIKALHFGMILFIAAYISYLLRASNGYWILISTAAILAGEDWVKIKSRTIGRVLGGVVGISFGFLLISLQLPILTKGLLLVALNILTEYYMPKNYLVANFFTNPQVLLLMSIGTSFTTLSLIPMRFSGALVGSLLAAILIFVSEFALDQIRPQKPPVA